MAAVSNSTLPIGASPEIRTRVAEPSPTTIRRLPVTAVMSRVSLSAAAMSRIRSAGASRRARR